MGGYSKHFSCGNSLLSARKIIVMAVKTKKNKNISTISIAGSVELEIIKCQFLISGNGYLLHP